MQENKNASSTLTLHDRKELVLGGILDVVSFDEGEIVLSTNLGDLLIEGEELKIENLSKEKGEIAVRGKISSLYYKDKPQKKKRFDK